jgi:hypothetical protein
MSYRVYTGPAGVETVPPLEKDHWLFKEFPQLDDALSFAAHVQKGGGVPLLIEGDDGTTLSKREIADALWHGRTH